jgi:uncharacterized protein (DUF1810 family)
MAEAADDPFHLDRFLTAQAGVIDAALGELRAGRKSGHWIWYVFPQLAGLGRSPLSRQYGISGIDEARAYLRHPVLRDRLVECAGALLIHSDRTADQILGDVDAMKVRSSMTLFHRADPAAPVFVSVLQRLYDGHPDPRTDELLRG